MKKLIAVVAAALSFNAMALTIDMTITANGRSSLKQMDKKTFTQYYEEASGSFELTVNENGEEQVITQEIPPQVTNSSNVTVSVVDKNSVRYIDIKNEIDIVIPAKVKKSTFGKIKGVTIAANQMVSLYSESLQREGLAALAGLNIDTDEVKMTTSFNFSDYSCSRDGNDLKCAQDMSINIRVEDKE